MSNYALLRAAISEAVEKGEGLLADNWEFLGLLADFLDDYSDPSVVSNWQPKWEVDVGAGCKVGVTIDDHCFVVLVPSFKMKGDEVEYTGEWKPTPWIPMAAARLIAEKSKFAQKEEEEN